MHVAQPFTQFINVPCYLVDPYIHDTYTRILYTDYYSASFSFRSNVTMFDHASTLIQNELRLSLDVLIPWDIRSRILVRNRYL